METRKIEYFSYDKAKHFWLKNLSGDITVMPDNSIAGSDNRDQLKVTYFLDESLSARISGICKNQILSEFTFFVVIIKVLFLKLYHENDLIIATSPISEPKANDFILLRKELDVKTSFRQILIDSGGNIADALKYSNFPLVEVFKLLEIEQYKSLFKKIIFYDKIHSIDECKSKLREVNYDLTFLLSKQNSRFELQVYYLNRKYQEIEIQTLVKNISRLLDVVLHNPTINLYSISLVTKDDFKLLNKLNSTEYKIEGNSIVGLFDDVFKKHGKKIAVRNINNENSDFYSLTYEELDYYTSNVAIYLSERNIGANVIVGLYIKNPVLQIIGMIGVLRSGAAYMPINNKFPSTTIDKILRDSNIKYLLTDNIVEFKLVESIFPIKQILNLERDSRVLLKPGKSDLAYVIYTSGTTGKPKGVLIDHGNLLNYVMWRIHFFQFDDADVTLQLLNYAFDGYNSNFFTTILCGGELVVGSIEEQENISALKKEFEKNKITNFSVVPYLFQRVLSIIKSEQYHSLRFIVLAGEVANEYCLSEGKKIFSNAKFYNEYGPTESTVATTINSSFDLSTKMVIGKPIYNMKIHVLDNEDNLVGAHSIGEIGISGDSVGRGYLNNVELTSEKFKVSVSGIHERFYRSGDLGYYSSHGDFVLVGRNDQQIKFKGYRVELEEIESKVLEYGKILMAIVVVKYSGANEVLVCYYQAEEKINNSELTYFLSGRLPNYMIPSAFIHLDNFPITPNGKIDRKSLSNFKIDTKGEFIKPINPVEIQLAEIWSDVLNLDQKLISTEHNFFNLGGNSFNINSLISKIKEGFSVNVSVSNIYENPYISELSKIIMYSPTYKLVNIKPAEKKEYYQTSMIQKKFYFIQKMYPDIVSYNIANVFPLDLHVSTQMIENAFNSLVQRHEILRTSFQEVDSQPVQVIQKYVDFRLKISRVNDIEEIDNTVNRNRKPFNFSEPPLFRAELIEAEDAKFLKLEVHHIILDQRSFLKLKDEIIHLLKNEKLTKPLWHYKDFTDWVQKLDYDNKYSKQESFWLNEFKDIPQKINLPYDTIKKKQTVSNGFEVRFQLDEEITKGIYDLASKFAVTNFIVGLSLFKVFLAKISGDESIVVGTAVDTKDDPVMDKIIGVMVNTLAIKSYPVKNKSFKIYLEELKKVAINIFENADYPFELLVSKVMRERDFSRHPLFDVTMTTIDLLTEVHNESIGDLIHKKRENQFDLELVAFCYQNKIIGSFTYSADLFQKNTINGFISLFKQTISEIVLNPDIKIIDILSDIYCREKKLTDFDVINNVEF